MSLLSAFLYARPSFIEGAGRIVDFGDTLTEYNQSMTGAQADYLALWADWRLLGLDVRNAIQEYKGHIQKDRPSVQEIQAK